MTTKAVVNETIRVVFASTRLFSIHVHVPRDPKNSESKHIVIILDLEVQLSAFLHEKNKEHAARGRFAVTAKQPAENLRTFSNARSRLTVCPYANTNTRDIFLLKR